MAGQSLWVLDDTATHNNATPPNEAYPRGLYRFAPSQRNTYLAGARALMRPARDSALPPATSPCVAPLGQDGRPMIRRAPIPSDVRIPLYDLGLKRPHVNGAALDNRRAGGATYQRGQRASVRWGVCGGMGMGWVRLGGLDYKVGQVVAPGARARSRTTTSNCICPRRGLGGRNSPSERTPHFQYWMGWVRHTT